MDDFDKIIQITNDIITKIDFHIIDTKYVYSIYNIGLHLLVLRIDKPLFVISNKCCIIENTMDLDKLYFFQSHKNCNTFRKK